MLGRGNGLQASSWTRRLACRHGSDTLRALIVEILNTGDELLLGYRLNTHQQWLGRRLADHGYRVSRQTSITDNGEAIKAGVSEALSRADLIVVTGGLGPTSDDLTRERISELLDMPLRTDETVLRHLDAFFAKRNREAPERVKVQALVPEGATVLPNAHGTAPGLAIEVQGGRFRESSDSSWLIMLPGPPRELYPMFDEQVVPLLEKSIPTGRDNACLNIRTSGLGESLVEEQLTAPLAELVGSGLNVHFCLSPGGVDVRLATEGPQATELLAKAEQATRDVLGKYIYGQGDELLEENIVHALAAADSTLALAESCTGGLIANRVTNVSGASKVLLAGYVTYSNEAKQKCLGVKTATLEAHGAVSEPTAREMAEGARRESGSDYAISVTGIAGPTGGTEEKPVGTVFIGLASAEKTIVMKFLNPYDRATFKQVTSQQALDLLRRRVQKDARKQ